MGSNRTPYEREHDFDGRPAVASWDSYDQLLHALWREHPEKAPLSAGRPQERVGEPHSIESGEQKGVHARF